MSDYEFKCNGCGEPCRVVKEYIHYAGTHCSHGKSGKHFTGHYISECCGDDYGDYKIPEEEEA